MVLSVFFSFFNNQFTDGTPFYPYSLVKSYAPESTNEGVGCDCRTLVKRIIISLDFYYMNERDTFIRM